MNDALLAWFDTSGRELAVRSTTDPWPTLVAEVMSHQTQIERVGPAWDAFLRRWPTPASLTTAETDALLRGWAGLGYNRRALALRDAARMIVSKHGGEVPTDVTALDALPGIGPYTARAVVATSFAVPVAPLDVNVRRVVARLLRRGPDEMGLQEAADVLVSSPEPRRWVHAIMDLAAAVCTRQRPRCARCPIAQWCASAGTAGEATPRQERRRARFEQTHRWLRGRIIARLREAAVSTWIDFDEPIGDHSPDAVRRALVELARDGFIEIDGTRARLV